MFSKACEYGIRAVVYIAEQSQNETRVSLKDIARQIDSPEAFTAKILQQLVHAGLIESVKGSGGGFEIRPSRIKKIRLSDVVLAIDGDSIYTMCALGLKDCSEDFPCPVHHKFKFIKKDIRAMLDGTSLLEMSEGVRDGHACLRFSG